MYKLKMYGLALGAYLKAWVVALDPAKGRSENGHVLLQGWKGVPEEEILHAFEKRRALRARSAACALYAFEGPHQGEVQFVPRGKSFLGLAANDGLTLTPGPGRPAEDLRLSTGHPCYLESKEVAFKVNGQETQSTALFDFDEVEVNGNKFLYLDLSSEGNHV